MLDFRVETFLAVCRHMNFTKAARDPTPQQKGSHRSARPGAAVAFQFTFRQLLTNATATSICSVCGNMSTGWMRVTR